MRNRIEKKFITGSVCGNATALVVAVFVLLGLPGISWAARSTPLLSKVFVYAGEQNVRLVALFDAPLDGSDPVPRLKNGTLSLFVRGVRGGKAVRQFVLGQGGYDRLEAREGKSGLWLTVRTKKGTARLEAIPGITRGKTSLTVTLPSLKILEVEDAGPEPRTPPVAVPRKEGASTSSFSGLKGGESGSPNNTASSVTSESILDGALSSPSTNPAPGIRTSNPLSPTLPKAETNPPLTLFRKKDRSSKLLAGSSKSDQETPQIGSNVVSFSGLAMKFAAVLGGILALIVGGLYFFKKLAPGAVSRLGGNGSLVRTIYRTSLAPKKSLALVEVAGEVLVLGISGQNITMLTKIENEETLERVRNAGESTFVDHLSRMISAQSKGAEKPPTPLLAAENESGKAVQKDEGEVVLPEKGAAALLAYARQVAPNVNSSGNGTGPGDHLDDHSGDEELEAPTVRSAARLRQRLNRVTSQPKRSGSFS